MINNAGGDRDKSFARDDRRCSSQLSDFQASTAGVILTARLRPHLGPELVTELVDHSELQALLKDEVYYSMITGLVRMNKSGRDYFVEAFRVLESVTSNVT
jgi:hypothetical protein